MTLGASLLALGSSQSERCRVLVVAPMPGYCLIGVFTMNTMIHSARRLLVLSLFSVGLAATSLTQAATPQFGGPRNTIPAPTASQPSSQLAERLQASTADSASCKIVRVVHYGHPGKGLDRVERMDTRCDKSRLSAR
jgi:hypothetical protein